MRPLLPVLAATGAALLAGCSLAPKYTRPASPAAAAYPVFGDNASPPASAASAADIGWREFLGDARLRELVALALENNRDLRVSALNVDRVRALYDIQRTALVPSLDATASGTRQRTPGDLSSSGLATTDSSYRAGLAVTAYEVDFFGRVASLRDQVLARYLATDEARRSAHISLVASVASQYFNLLAAEEQRELARQTLAAVDASLGIVRSRRAFGTASELDLASAEAQVQTARANLASAEQQRAQAANALDLLVGRALPDDLPAPGPLSRDALLADLPAGLPSDLLARRPDILAAEFTLQAANANIGVARAAFFPSVTLTAFGGSSSAALDGLFKSGSGAWSFAPQITVPIFAAGRNRATLKVAEIENRIEIATYEKTIQTAFREVADSLATRATIEDQLAAQTARVAAQERRLELSDLRYKNGADDYLSVLLARQDLYTSQQALIQTRLARLTNLITLYKALGGGWSA